MLLAVMNLSAVLQLEGAQGFQGPQQNLGKQMVKARVMKNTRNAFIFHCNLYLVKDFSEKNINILYVFWEYGFSYFTLLVYNFKAAIIHTFILIMDQIPTCM